jgi:putative phosphoesterase
MRIAVVSDTHSRYETVDKVIKLLHWRDVGLVVHCGDLEDAETVWQFEGLAAHFVFGNCDYDRHSIRQAVHGIGGGLHEHFGKLEIEGTKIAWTHGDHKRLFRELEQCGKFDYLFYGHSHQAEQHRTGPTLVVNPGALHRARPKTFVILDTSKGSLESIIVD